MLDEKDIETVLEGHHRAGRMDRLSALVVYGVNEQEWKLLKQLAGIVDRATRGYW